MKITRRFTTTGQDVYDTVEWTLRTKHSPSLEGGGKGVGEASDSGKTPHHARAARSTHPLAPSLVGRGRPAGAASRSFAGDSLHAVRSSSNIRVLAGVRS